MNKSKLRKWFIIQKVTISRGYSYVSVAMLGVIFASSVKSVLPGIINNFAKFIILTIISFLLFYIIGLVDKWYGFLSDEQIYAVETNPLMMNIVKNTEVRIK